MTKSEGSIKQLSKNLVHFENAMLLITEEYNSWLRQNFVQKSHTFVNSFVGLHWADYIELFKVRRIFFIPIRLYRLIQPRGELL